MVSWRSPDGCGRPGGPCNGRRGALLVALFRYLQDHGTKTRVIDTVTILLRKYL